jgi:DNA primase
MPGVDYTEVRRQITMSEVLQLVGFTANRIRGDQQRGPCPIHGSSREDSRIFSVNLELGRYQCFQYGSRGNALELWSAVRGVSVYRAAIELCEMLGKPIPWKTRW